MIHFAIGTKAQFIKMVPVMKQLVEKGIAYRYIDLGQHAATTGSLRQIFDIKEPDVSFAMSGSVNVASLKTALKWTVSLFRKTLRTRKQAMERMFDGQPGVCIIHGDTLSTFLGLLAAKRAGIKVFHLEAGLRSRNLFHPFPEEILRLVCMKYADYLAAPSDEALKNLQNMGYAGKALHTFGNTGTEGLADMLPQLEETATQAESFALFSIHRFETVMSRNRLQLLVNFILACVKKVRVHFVVHEPTHQALERYGYLQTLGNHGVKQTPLLDYPAFLGLLKTAEFVVTDGGSIQEECAALGTPCLIFRKRTERPDGLGENACLSQLESETMKAFLQNYRNYRRPATFTGKRPSEIIIDFLKSKGFDKPENTPHKRIESEAG